MSYVWAMVAGVLVGGTDVTSEAERRQTLLEYIAGRDDLSSSERKDWEKAVRLEFGGKAVKDGTDEGVTSAKSVIAAAIFHRIPPKQGAKAAYAAYHDTYRYVPPPIAVDYQLLHFLGRGPKEDVRAIAFDFPRYFNPEMAVDVVAYWDGLLADKNLTAHERDQIKELLRATRDKMRPMLRDRLWEAALLELRIKTPEAHNAPRAELEKDLQALEKEITHDFRDVARTRLSGDYYERYRTLARELGGPVKERPTRASLAPPPTPKLAPAPPAQESPAPSPTPKPTPPPVAEAPKAKETPAAPQRPPEPPKPVETPKAKETPQAPAKSAPEERKLTKLPGAGWLDTLSKNIAGWLGTPYLFGGTSKKGVDCSAFVKALFFETFNIELPRDSRAQSRVGVAVQQHELITGDLIFFDTLDRGRITHVGMYVGDGFFVHASSSKGVTKAELKQKYYQRAYRTSRRILN